MRSRFRLISLLVCLPTLGVAQTPRSAPVQGPIFEVLSDSQWIRVASPGHGFREARLLEQNASEIVLDLEPRPLRIPATSIDTLWARKTASSTGALIGGLLGGAIGVVIATQAVEEGETPSADWVGLIGIGGAVGGGLLGAVVGLGIPKWHRVYPR